jgi:RNA-directed DNA polymerase
MDRRGLPQGSAASSLVAEMVMAEILREAAGRLADVLCLHTYSDNLGGLVPLNRDEAALVECLKNVFATHRAGPFRMTSRVDRMARSFPYLGYPNDIVAKLG